MTTYTFTCKQRMMETSRCDVDADSPEEALKLLQANEDTYVWERYDIYEIDSTLNDEFQDSEGNKHSSVEIRNRHEDLW